MNWKNISTLDKLLPEHVFVEYMELFGWTALDMFSTNDIPKYIRWEPIDDGRSADDIANDYGFEDIEEMAESRSGYCVLLFADGVLVLE